MDPIFMIGIQRSGSNLLRLMLNQLPEIAAPHPPHILQRLMPLRAYYGNLAVDENFSRLVDDVCRLVELNPVVWEGVNLDRNDVARRCHEKNIVAVHGAVYDICAESQGAKTWCCKSLANIQYVPQIEAYFKTPKYIYLYRDGRDVALSFRKAVVGEKHYYHIAKEWASIQELALNLRETIEPARFLGVRYEDLITKTEACARSICAFLGAEFSPAMFNYASTAEAKRAAEASDLWKNVTGGIIKTNIKKYRREMTIAECELFESIAGRTLERLGYQTAVVPSPVYRLSPEAKACFDFENKRLKAEILKTIDPKDLERRLKQDALIAEIEDRQPQHNQ